MAVKVCLGGWGCGRRLCGFEAYLKESNSHKLLLQLLARANERFYFYYRKIIRVITEYKVDDGGDPTSAMSVRMRDAPDVVESP